MRRHPRISGPLVAEFLADREADDAERRPQILLRLDLRPDVERAIT
jgi:hypothetical protein